MLAPCPFKCVLREVRLQVTQCRKQWNLSFLPIRISIKGFVNIYEGSKFQTRLGAMKHGHGTRGVALAFDAATRRGRRCPSVLPRRATWIPHVFCQRGSNLGRFALNQADSGLNRLYRPELTVSAETADFGRNSKKKKKKGCRTHCLTYF